MGRSLAIGTYGMSSSLSGQNVEHRRGTHSRKAYPLVRCCGEPVDDALPEDDALEATERGDVAAPFDPDAARGMRRRRFSVRAVFQASQRLSVCVRMDVMGDPDV